MCEKERASKTIEVCHGQNCHPYGGEKLAQALEQRGVDFVVIRCRSLCTYAPIAFVDGRLKMKATLDDVCEGVDGA